MADGREVEVEIPSVLSIAGETLLQDVGVSSMEQLKNLAAEKLGARRCTLLNAEGHVLQKLDEVVAGSTLTAVALTMSPLLQMVGLEDKEGNPFNPSVPLEDVETVALEVAKSVAKIGCWFGGPGHLEGCPTVSWKFGHIMPPPPSFEKGRRSREEMEMKITDRTRVVHAGARLIFTVAEGSLVPKAVEDFTTEKTLVVRDLMNFRRVQQEACNKMRRELLATKEGADSVDARISLRGYAADVVQIELGYDVYNEETDGYW
mmetsp:Transcript_55458/g.104168  ORF Transcript_55458/g.104168 Transcript_55458/m.104168 type:complete len:261 (+) Transcript_55458:59-841(+)